MRYKMYEFNPDDAYSFARHVGIEVKQRGNNLHFKTCPYCRPRATKDNVNTFAIDLKTGQFKCLRDSCGVHGNMITLSRDFDFSLGNEVDEYYRPKKTYRKFKTPKEKIVPKPPAIEHLGKRGISKEVVEKYEITTKNGRDDVLVFPFYDENGVLQFIKYRDALFFKGKSYKNKEGEEVSASKEWCEKNCKPILFGMKQCNDKYDTLILTEGQCDSLAVATAEYENVVSVPTGSVGFTWVPYCFNWVSKFDEIIVFGDYEKGKMSLLEDVQKRFPNRIKHVRYEDYKDCKDANEILLKYGIEQIKVCVENAEMVPVKRVIELADVESVNIYELPKLKTGLRLLDQFLYGGLPFGNLVLIAGKRGEGKSTFGSQILGQAIEQGYSSFAYSGELPNYLYKSWFDFQIAGRNHIIENTTSFGTVNRFITNRNQELINEWYRGKARIYDNSIIQDDEKENLLKTIEESIMQYGTKVILLDNLMTAMYIDEPRGTDKYERQGLFVNELRKIALRYDVLILLVVHKRKNGYSSDTNDEVSGTGDITNMASLTITYAKGDQSEIDKGFIEESQRKIIVGKNRLFGKINTEGFISGYDEKSKRIFCDGDSMDYEFGWNKEGFIQQEDDEESPFT